MNAAAIFDDWPEKYDQWFTTPIGRLIHRYESELVCDMLKPMPGEKILDAGCGTGVFTRELVQAKSCVTGIELSLPMLLRAQEKMDSSFFLKVLGDMSELPFAANTFDKVMSITAIEFIKDARQAVAELFRVTRPAGTIVVATLNHKSPWAERRKEKAKRGHTLFKTAIFRSPAELRRLSPARAEIKTAIHFEKHQDPARAAEIEAKGMISGCDTGAFIAIKWVKEKQEAL